MVVSQVNRHPASAILVGETGVQRIGVFSILGFVDLYPGLRNRPAVRRSDDDSDDGR